MEMVKAYDIKVLAERAKALGLEISEEGCKDLFLMLMGWLKDSAKISPNMYDDMAAGFASSLEGFVLAKIDDINPADNPAPAPEAAPEAPAAQ